MGCGTIRPKAELLRLVAVAGRVVADPAATLPGRGAYVCGPGCAQRAIERRAIGRALRGRADISEDFVESIRLHGKEANP
ncbi:YlxR family protein [Conexibacter woesei]|uniref:YlxR family protein n=1 Tax=Conexibacter woesei TaxID=191495 RepID=UPI0009DBA075